MKESQKYLRVIMMAICLILTLWCNAQSQGTQGSQGGNATATKVPIKNKKEPSPVMRPHSPSMQQIECYYQNGVIYIEFNLSEGECQMTVTSDMGIDEYFFNSSFPSEIYVGEIEKFSVEISTEKGNIYEGGIH